ncbi:hypothetical protein L1887_32057 [Cichorium endivia]|nr:hypothetical protein L1887_32057 [Cichorium endivia]
MYHVSVANSVGGSNRAPIIIPSEYSSWVTRMEFYLAGHESDIWQYISTGIHSLDIIGNVNVPPPDVPAGTARIIGATPPAINAEALKKKNLLEARAMQELLSALKRQFEGTAKILASRKKAAMNDIDAFKMYPDESIYDAYTRYNILINRFKMCCGEKYQEEINMKILNNLTPKWANVKMLITQTTPIYTTSLYDLYRELQVHKATVNQNAHLYGGPLALSTMLSTAMLHLSSETEDDAEYGQLLALLSNFNPNFKNFFKKPSGNSRSLSYQQPQHFNQNSGNLQGGNQPPKPPNSTQFGEKIVKTKEIRCHKCQGLNHYAKDYKSKEKKVKDIAYYLNKAAMVES